MNENTKKEFHAQKWEGISSFYVSILATVLPHQIFDVFIVKHYFFKFHHVLKDGKIFLGVEFYKHKV